MDNIGALPLRMDLHAASTSTIFSPAFRRFWLTRSTLSRCCKAALPPLAKLLAKAKRYVCGPLAFSAQSSLYVLIQCGRSATSRRVPIEKGQSVKLGPRPHSTPIAAISSSEKPYRPDSVIAWGHIEWVPKESVNNGPSAVAL